MNNAKIAAAFDQVADLLEFKNSNPFRVRAYRKAARVVGDLPEAISDIVSDPERSLTDIDGIGKDLAEKCAELISTGHLQMLDDLLEDTPRTVLDLMRVPGLGPKKAAAVFSELGVASLPELKAACEAQQVRGLKGFGAKTEASILAGIEIASAANQRLLWAEADAIAEELRTFLASVESLEQIELAGSYRRGKDTVGDLDILVVSRDAAAVMDRFATYPDLESIIGRGDTKMSIRLGNGFQVDLRVVPAESFGAALQYFTGSKDHNVILRGKAKQMGLKINEYGVYRTDTDEYVAGRTEADVYRSLGLPEFPPELREARQEFEWAEQGDLPKLIELDDMRGDLHMHTTATDGTASIDEMAAAAQARGLSYIAITDHSQRVSMARGLTPARALEQWAEIDRWNAANKSRFLILKGIECDILESGGLDLPDDVLSQADWVMASVHYGQKQSARQITDRILGAIRNPYVSAIAHPTGRLLNRREAYEVHMDEVMQAAAEYGKLLELNANPHRLDLNDVDCAAAKKRGIPIVISTDAHSIDGLDVMRFGIKQARRAGLTASDVANTQTWAQLKKRVGRS
ncbi:MAG: DNA polymerase/3'-5' exonuclease PolX [Planctomycetales bacterium]|nr:DNA polymerase/3'-5' exonuclease PolX [Planctomycetales bacterium]MCA9169656.1 DNA polymerase/3'-5' exonuclease PolX [Planctomycetales bacterium]